jgi:hypothetical protein
MSDEKHWRLWINDVERTDGCEHIDVTMPRLVYDVPHDGRWQRRVLGAGGFAITVTNPSRDLLKLVDDGEQTHALKVDYRGHALSVPVQFHMDWAERSGVRKMFGCLAVDADSLPKWVTESDVHAGERGEEGGQ